jgi:hypothetical protein
MAGPGLDEENIVVASINHAEITVKQAAAVDGLGLSLLLSDGHLGGGLALVGHA